MTSHATSARARSGASAAHMVRTTAGPRAIRERSPGHLLPPSELDPASRAKEAESLAGALGRWYVEALSGRRDGRQLRRLLTPVAEHRVRTSVLRQTTAARRAKAGRARHLTTVPRVRSARVQEVADRYEAIAIIDDGVRITAVVSVLHATNHGWVVSELARPEDGLPALPVPVIPTH